MLDLLANLAEILAGLAIIYSVIKVSPFLDNLSTNKRLKPMPLDDTALTEMTATLTANAQYTGPALRSHADVLNAILKGAMALGAAAVHIRQSRQGPVRISARIDGKSFQILEFPKSHYAHLREAIIDLDDGTNVKNPFEARIQTELLPGLLIRTHIHFADTNEGESIHMSISHFSAGRIGLDALGMDGIQRETLDRWIERLVNHDQVASRGLVLFTGRMSEGKTVSLYNTVNLLQDKEIEIASIEDPIELDTPGLQQMDVQDIPGYRFADRFSNGALYGGLDALMIGEVRSEEIASAALLFAANAGVVFTTITAADANKGFAKFCELAGEHPRNTPVLVVTQVLFRTLCKHCRGKFVPEPADELLIESLSDDAGEPTGAKWCKPVGCEVCGDGYQGRRAAFEVYENDGENLHRVGRTIGENLLHNAAKGRLGFAEMRRVLPS